MCVITTLTIYTIYFFPKNEVLFHNKQAGLKGKEITAIANGRLSANYFRSGKEHFGFFADLMTFRTQNKNEK